MITEEMEQPVKCKHMHTQTLKSNLNKNIYKKHTQQLLFH
jgi:hypothetical protein